MLPFPRRRTAPPPEVTPTPVPMPEIPSGHRVIKVRPASAQFIERIAESRRLQLASVVDILVDGFKRLPADVQAQLFGDGAGAGAA